ncbi:leucine-rich melanocyte differentiation-associated protein isoform X1 [Photinus pyralis]|uniref:leucine-rich melanocyte differentiation-associated protein isoform X1 n=2 Tax=Photinus pyralis TaxID=7054 RepID=UPI001266ED0C|nr:leucine-rich melanocyte differentiation-associated protein isoform X1 [Photinus pyralis]
MERIVIHECLIHVQSESSCNDGNYTKLQSFISYTFHINSLSGYKHTKLCYSGQKCYRIPEALVKMYGPKVQSLDLSYNELVSLRGMEGFPLLRELVLDNNQLTDSLVLPYLPHLHTLSLNKNCINDIELLITKIIHNLPTLTYLSLLGNKACPNQLSDIDKDEEDYQRYRYYVLHRLPALQFLDSTKVKDSERLEAKLRGQYMKIIRPKHVNLNIAGDAVLQTLTPLPRSVRKPEDHRGAYERCKYRYSGKNSEGNRFISNNDL